MVCYQLSYLYIQEYERSIEDLGSLKQDTTIYNDEINWYYSLALILNGDIEKAKKSLTRIGTNGWNFSKAQVLLKSLE